MNSLVGMNNNKSMDMKKIFFTSIILSLVMIISSNIFAQTKSTNVDKIDTVIVVGNDANLKGTIEGMEKNGWIFDHMTYNDESDSWTVHFYRYPNKKGIKVIVRDNKNLILNGAYRGTMTFKGELVEKIDYYENNVIVKSTINGREIDLQTWEYID